jgi:dephospho-CoA kinase
VCTRCDILVSMIIVGITGTPGSGKTEFATYLTKKGFAHLSARAFLIREASKIHTDLTRERLLSVANKLRKEHSPSYVIESLFKEAQELSRTKGKNCILESIRTPGEVDYLKSESKKNQDSTFFLVAIDADREIRYKRIKARNSETDHVSLERFIEDETKEMQAKEPHEANISECIRRADHTIVNNGTIEDLHHKIELFLKRVA